MEDTTDSTMRAVSIPVPDKDELSGYQKVDVSVHFKAGAFLAFKSYADKLTNLGWEVEIEGSSYAARDYPIIKARSEGVLLTGYGPDFPEPEPRPEEPSVMDKLVKAMIAEDGPAIGEVADG